jgi:8-oxo-dGTP diphosphatase
MAERGRYIYDYPRPAVTVDLVIQSTDAEPCVLLIRRRQPPYQGAWALPGGFVEPDEPLEQAARRELHEETGVSVESLVQLGAFGDPGRDPRGWTVSVAFLARVPANSISPVAADDALDVAWHPMDRLPVLAFDHAEILKAAQLCAR